MGLDLNGATQIYLGGVAADRLYLGAGQLWPAPVGGFVEQGVRVAGGAALQGEILPGGQRSFLFFASYIKDDVSGRYVLFSTNGADGAMYADYGGDALTNGYRMQLKVQPENVGFTVTRRDLYPHLTRTHMLAVGRVDDAAMNLKVWMWNDTTGIWKAHGDVTKAILAGNSMDLNSNAVRLFENTSGAHQFPGVTYRQALWTWADPLAAPDIDQAAIQAQFAQSATIADPAISQAAYGAAHFDIYGNAADFAAGSHAGSMALTAILPAGFTDA